MKGREQAYLLLQMAEQDLYLLQAHAQDPKLKDDLYHHVTLAVGYSPGLRLA